jgi:hypothetical protein
MFRAPHQKHLDSISYGSGIRSAFCALDADQEGGRNFRQDGVWDTRPPIWTCRHEAFSIETIV